MKQFSVNCANKWQSIWKWFNTCLQPVNYFQPFSLFSHVFLFMLPEAIMGKPTLIQHGQVNAAHQRKLSYRQTSNISYTLVGNKIVDHSACRRCSNYIFMDWLKTTARQGLKRLSAVNWCVLYWRFDGIMNLQGQTLCKTTKIRRTDKCGAFLCSGPNKITGQCLILNWLRDKA